MLFRRHSVAGLFGVAEAAIPKNRLTPSRPISTCPRMKAASAQQGTDLQLPSATLIQMTGKIKSANGQHIEFSDIGCDTTEELE
jgi:hypothetical protein